MFGADSFDEFINNTMQTIVDDSGDIRVTPEAQFAPGQEAAKIILQIKFGQVYLSKPMVTEKVCDYHVCNKCSPEVVRMIDISVVILILSIPFVSQDNTLTYVFPHEARLRNLTYW